MEEMQSPWKMVRLFIHTVHKILRSHGIFDVQWNFWHLMESFTSWIFYLSKHAQYYTTYKVMIVTQFPYIASLCPYFHTRVLSLNILDKITHYNKIPTEEKNGASPADLGIFYRGDLRLKIYVIESTLYYNEFGGHNLSRKKVCPNDPSHLPCMSVGG